MELSQYDIFKSPLSWHELFEYVVYRHTVKLLTE